MLQLAPGSDAFERIGEGLGDARAVLQGADGRVHVATSRGLYRLAGNGDAVRSWPLDADRMINTMVEDGRGRLWLAIPREGIVVFDPADGHVQWLKADAGAGSPPDAIATNLSIDRSGLLWIGTHERGLAKVDPDGTPFQHVAEGDAAHLQTATNYIRSIAEDADGSLWLGTEAGLKRYYPDANRFQSYAGLVGRDDVSGTAMIVHAVARAPDGAIWLGTNEGAARLDAQAHELALVPITTEDDGQPGAAEVRAIEVARDGSLWIGTMHAGLVHHDPRTRISRQWRREATGAIHGGLGDDRVLAVHQDRAGRVWAASMTGLNLVDPASGRVRVIRKVPADPKSLSANLVRTIHETADGDLWFGTQFGLNRLESLDADGAHFTRWLPRDGLPGGTVYALASDAMGRIWLSTNRGIASFEHKSGKFHAFTLADGLQGMEYNGGAVATLRNGRIAFGGTNGFNLFAPQSITASRYPRRSRSRGCRSGRTNWRCRMRKACRGWMRPTASSASNSPRSIMPRRSATASAIAWTDSTTTGSTRARATKRPTPTSARAPTPSTCGRATTTATGAATSRAPSWRWFRRGGKPRRRARRGCCSLASPSCCRGARGAGSGGRSSCTIST